MQESTIEHPDHDLKAVEWEDVHGEPNGCVSLECRTCGEEVLYFEPDALVDVSVDKVDV